MKLGRAPAAVASVIQALEAADIPRSVQAEALGVSLSCIDKWRRVHNASKPRQAHDPIDGEVWIDRPDLGVRVSDQGRFASLKTGLALKVTTPPPGNGGPYVTVRIGTPTQTVMRTAVIVAETFGLDWTPSRNAPWSEAEKTALRNARTYAEAQAALPGRKIKAIHKQAQVLGIRMARPPKKVKPPRLREPLTLARGSVPYRDPVWAAAEAAVPRWVPHDEREDLISDIYVMTLEGFTGTPAEALAIARKARNAVFGAFKERSIFDPIPGADGLRLIDTFEAGASL